MRKIFLIFALFFVANAKCVKNDNDTVSCSKSALLWQDDANVSEVDKTWKQSIGYCEKLVFAGFDDWRLPNSNELESIIDYQSYDRYAIDGAFKKTDRIFWSSSTYAGDKTKAWVVDFSKGYCYPTKKNKSWNRYVRCVREEKK